MCVSHLITTTDPRNKCLVPCHAMICYNAMPVRLPRWVYRKDAAVRRGLSGLELLWFWSWNRLRNRILALFGPLIMTIPDLAHFYWNHWNRLQCWNRLHWWYTCIELCWSLLQLAELPAISYFDAQNRLIFQNLKNIVWKYTVLNILLSDLPWEPILPLEPIPTLDQIPLLEPIPPWNRLQLRLICPNCDSDSWSGN